jgi:hypothetical protein
MDFGLTLEHTPPGSFPEWLFHQLQDQVLLPTMEPLLVIHSSDASRSELLSRLEASEIGPIDRSRHHTLASLWKSLHADLRLPRLLSSSAAANRLLHSECEQAAREGEFPFLHPTPEHRWGEGRTRALTRLARTFDVENIRSWDGPGIDGFNKRLKRMGKKMNGMHPLLHRRTIIDTLEDSDSTPFTITGIAGIVIMDQMPTLSQSDRRLLLSLNRFSHIHQLCQHGDASIGNYRMGFHGAILEDVHPVTEETMPTWLQPHEIWQPKSCDQFVHRVLVPRGGLGIPATLEVLRDWVQSADSNARALIIDPGWKNRAEQWRRGLAEVGLRLSRDTTALKAAPSIHWLGETASIGQGPEAWSMSRIRGLGTQQSLRFISEWLHHTPHPDHSDWVPEMDANRLEGLARSWHILGGHGALSRWLRALASPSYPAPWEDRDEAGRQAECTQWWFLSLLSRLSPLLSSGERALLDETALSVGCFTGAQLPLPPAANDGNQWVSHLLAHIDWESMHNEAGSLQRLLEEYTHYRSSQLTLEHSIVSIGPKWAEQFLCLIEDMEAPTKIEAGDQIQILTPEESLGVTADIIILTHLTNSGWALRTEKLPWLDEATCKELNLCRPDAPLRDARHALHHLLHASSTVIIIDGSGLDEDCQPAAPIAEWFSLHGGANSAELVLHPSFMTDWSTAASERTRGHHLAWFPSTIEMIRNDGPARAEIHLSGRSIRDNRQRVGLSLRASHQPISPPLRPESISLPLDTSLMQDRLRRQPTKVQSGKEYLGMELHDRYCGVGSMKIVPTGAGAPGEITPRDAVSWPVLGGKSGRSHLLANDPRPLAPSSTSLPVFDQRHGLTGGAKHTRTRWSASRLQRWQACPRQGWLERRLNAGRLEQQNEDLDARIRGDLVHGSLGTLFENVFTLHEHAERSSVGASSLANMGCSVEDLFAYILDYVGSRAPWLEREDATASQRRHDLVGLNRKPWMDWLASPKPMPPSGRLGNLLLAELELYNSIPISIEWSLNGIDVEHPDGRTMKLTGFIDRVDVFNSTIDEDGDETVAPLDWSKDSKWKPKRLILIRDIKSVDGPKAARIGERHRKALFDELQLGLYARSWEIAHPGDLVIGVGISEVGSFTNHSLEISPAFTELLDENGVGDITTFTHDTHRLPDEESEASSDPFRAWMRERLTTAFDVADAANSGRVHATPEEYVCTWCKVKEACGLAPIVGGDSTWN